MPDDVNGPFRDNRLRLIKPKPPALSGLQDALREIEERGVYSNYGPLNTAFERALESQIFGGGHCLTVSSATSGLLLALKQAAFHRPGRRYAMMPSFTFAATAHAALWAGLTPLLVDVDPVTWLASAEAEQAALDRYGEQVAVVVPCATFGYPVDVARYDGYERTYGCATVLDAASGIGSRHDGRQISAGARAVSIFSIHATKTFATFEGGVVHGEDAALVAELRAMGNFGFVEGRSAVLPGLNTKLSEVGALVGLARLETFEQTVARRDRLAAEYRRLLPDYAMQPPTGEPQSHMFFPLLLPAALAGRRGDVKAQLARAGIETGCYYSPHLAEQSYFTAQCVTEALPVSQDVADRVMALPTHDDMDLGDVGRVATALRRCCEA